MIKLSQVYINKITGIKYVPYSFGKMNSPIEGKFFDCVICIELLTNEKTVFLKENFLSRFAEATQD